MLNTLSSEYLLPAYEKIFHGWVLYEIKIMQKARPIITLGGEKTLFHVKQYLPGLYGISMAENHNQAWKSFSVDHPLILPRSLAD
jgi:hypothetical protein